MRKTLIYAFALLLAIGSNISIANSDVETGLGVVEEKIVQQQVTPEPNYRERLEQMASRGEIRVKRMEITAYSATIEDCGKDDGITASGKQIYEGVVAADPSIPFGTKLYIEDIGEVIVEDRGGAIRGDILDLYVPERRDAIEWGRQVKQVYFIEKE